MFDNISVLLRVGAMCIYTTIVQYGMIYILRVVKPLKVRKKKCVSNFFYII